MPMMVMRHMKRCSSKKTGPEQQDVEAAAEDDKDDQSHDPMRMMMANMSPTVRFVTLFVFIASIGAMVAEGVILPKAIQTALGFKEKLTKVERQFSP